MSIYFRYAAALIAAAAAISSLSGCGLVSDNESSGETDAQSQAATSRRYIETTRTMSQMLEPDGDDDDLEGYTTTTSLTGSLENPYSMDDQPDPDILATLTTTTTLYTLPEGAERITTTKETKKTSEKTSAEMSSAATTTTTAFAADKLYKPFSEDMYPEKVKYHIVSDTTYLNLRFGPSKKYDVQLRIPDGEYVYGTAETANPDDDSEKWVYVSYNGTSGWVMRALIEKA